MAVNVSSTAPGKAVPHRAWDDVSVRAKIALVAAVASVWGTAAGAAVTQWHLGTLALLLGCAVVTLATIMLGRMWIAQPIEDIVVQLQRITRPERPLSTSKLPRHRQDEIGRLARAVHQMNVQSRRDRVDANQLRRTLDSRVEHATRRATAQLSQLAMRDPMTTLANRRFIEHHLEDLVQTCRSSCTDLICIMMDLDNFKPINDTLGHKAGDALIAAVGKIIKASVREQDYAVRMGGDEFAVFMPHCDTTRADQFAARLRVLIREQAQTLLGNEQHLDVSVGISSLRRDSVSNGLHLLEVADDLLYQAKSAGKGRNAGA
ncbi:MAG: GGDEF domain-containing protein [Phycisphaerales bacterium]